MSEDNYMCMLCDLVLSRACKLAEHLKIHSLEPPEISDEDELPLQLYVDRNRCSKERKSRQKLKPKRSVEGNTFRGTETKEDATMRKAKEDTSRRTKTGRDTTERKAKSNTSWGTETEGDTSRRTSAESDTSKGTKAKKDTSMGTKEEKDTLGGTKAKKDTSKRTETKKYSREKEPGEDASRGTKTKRYSSRGTEAKRYNSRITETEGDISRGKGGKGDTDKFVPYKKRCYNRHKQNEQDGNDNLEHSSLEYCQRNAQQPYGCIHCDKNFQFPSQLRVHFRSHENKKTYLCEVCGVILKSTKKINAHIQSHSAKTSNKMDYFSILEGKEQECRGTIFFECLTCREPCNNCAQFNDGTNDENLILTTKQNELQHRCSGCGQLHMRVLYSHEKHETSFQAVCKDKPQNEAPRSPNEEQEICHRNVLIDHHRLPTMLPEVNENIINMGLQADQTNFTKVYNAIDEPDGRQYMAPSQQALSHHVWNSQLNMPHCSSQYTIDHMHRTENQTYDNQYTNNEYPEFNHQDFPLRMNNWSMQFNNQIYQQRSNQRSRADYRSNVDQHDRNNDIHIQLQQLGQNRRDGTRDMRRIDSIINFDEVGIMDTSGQSEAFMNYDHHQRADFVTKDHYPQMNRKGTDKELNILYPYGQSLMHLQNHTDVIRHSDTPLVTTSFAHPETVRKEIPQSSAVFGNGAAVYGTFPSREMTHFSVRQEMQNPIPLRSTEVVQTSQYIN